MKNTHTLIYICIALSVINIIAIVFNARPSNASVKNSLQANLPSPSSGPSEIFFPESSDLAGEKVPLQRLDIQEALQKELIVNTYLHSYTTQILKTAPRIFSIIEPILKQNGIPDDFKYLAVIESNLNASAVSPAGATGIWQLMKETAKELGLEVNNEVDERYNIEKSTEAATKFLKKAYDKFGSWTLAAASYNAGATMVSRQMNIQQEDNYYNLLLGEETGRYVFRILALKQIMNHPELYQFYVGSQYPVEKTKKITINGPVDNWAVFAKEQDITYKTLKRFNPWLRQSNLKNPSHRTYDISIPVKKELYK